MSLKKSVFQILILSILFNSAQAQLNSESVLIPMSDGQNLAADLYLPNDVDEFSTILIQTPYNKNGFKLTGLPLGVNYDIAQSNYAFLIVDWRCYWGSSSACSLTANNGDDGYDVVQWIAEQEWSNGKIGTWGPSALGSVQFQTAREQPENLVCAVPIVVSPEIYYEKYFEGGSARVDYLDFVGIYFGLAGLIAANPYYNFLWSITESSSRYYDEIEIPMLIIGGWYDHNTDDCIDAFNALVHESSSEVKDQHKLLMGPWTHNFVGNESQGQLEYPQAVGWDDSLAIKFFEYHLLDFENGWEDQAKVQYFQIGENEWKYSNNWPPSENEELTFYLRADQKIGNDLESTISRFNYLYDPEDPSPSSGGKTFGLDLFQLNTGPKDIREEVEERNDNVIFTSEEFDEALNINGKVRTKIYFSSDRPDTDLALRLTDVYPDGRSIIIGESYQRMHMRNGYSVSDKAYLDKDEIYEVEMEFENLAYSFLPGHRMRLVITSSNYPRFNRNMNTGEEMYPNGNLDTLVNPLIAENTIHVSQAHPSAITLPIENTSVSVMDELMEKNGVLSIYPNPAQDYFTIRITQIISEVNILNLEGKVLQSRFFEKQADQVKIEINELTPGFYILQVKDIDDNSYIEKLIVLGK